MTVDIVTAVRTGVAAAFLVAGLAKLFDPASVMPFLHEMGVPWRAMVATRRGLPVLELAIATAMLVWPGRWTTIGALVLASAFAVVLWWARANGVAAGCRCYGRLDTHTLTLLQPVRATTLLVAVLFLLAIDLSMGSGPAGPSITAIAIGLLGLGTWLLVFAIGARAVAVGQVTRRIKADIQNGRVGDGIKERSA